MDCDVVNAIELYKFSDELRAKALAGLTRDELLHRASEISNPLIWMAGHLAVTRFRIGNVLGEEETTPMEELFGYSSKAAHESQYPSLEEIESLHDSATKRMFDRLRSASTEKLRQKTPRADYSVGEAVNRMVYHEGLHVGQMFFLRKLLGRRPDDPIMD
jgi:hypothetical protein